MAYFSIVGNHFQPEKITEELAIQPTETHVKGDIIKKTSTTTSSGTRRWVETDWTLSTGYQESPDINDQLKPLLRSLEGKEKNLIRLKEEYELTYIFMIVIEIENNEKPAMYFEKDIINFASTIDAEIQFDLYIYS
ncbi:DUF4279 domain-containing protein [Planococcus sp. PAMC 21323]|uniref:DUF4279 domain-containing protein n=1 Tax=Planococcus sp. PAMC 21323 TaxID=1526927 RepID=UPI000570BEDE|nr:DUF4279 domain-containing protein [Planococcus sp. PAMC 21323]